ncbi:anhydro-N-acetylmuramic acid kinase [Psychromonas sp. psych-6C06]|uniref:anhydro-N-acetylmuramic acid kinase n=1 Tax=Psychromonas sp. psych-6C06 TaxID=2058089 RepID=UPI000C33F374|nr:anhydro-N-acetylmuramic acid kinase [Psychromonas sp. psych-6C06]PKF61520.1 anhydro-N-acetylmuramic acid kinase [Psychromonas sp. psych-6C06]
MIGNYYIGIMSGTSLDAIDVVIAQRTEQGLQQIAGLAPTLPEQLRAQLLTICSNKATDLQTLGEVDHLFALTCADAVNQLLHKAGMQASQISAVGSHGQTIFHSPLSAMPFTQQIGDANIIAAKTGIPCISDFRRMDMAYGGQGAPLVPAFHQALFSQQGEQRTILNIGGIANISILGADNSVLGYDTGPGNMLMDAWVDKCLGHSFDKGASFALQGEVHLPLLIKLLADPYFTLNAPKSTGREKFNLNWLIPQLNGIDASDVDIQRTLLEFSALTISDQIKQHSDSGDVFVCGGGALNPLLMQCLQQQLTMHKVQDTHALNVDPMYVEAIAFAWLAEQRLLEKPIPLKAVTGAQKDAILGCVYLP